MRRSDTQFFEGRSQWWLDVIIGMTIVWLGCMGLEAMATATQVREAEANDRDLAAAIAQGERERIELLPYDEIEPTDGFVAPSWIHDHAREPGQIAVLSQSDDEGGVESEHLYNVRWNVENVDRFGAIRRITISVEWVRPNQQLGRIVLTSLRAGDHNA